MLGGDQADVGHELPGRGEAAQVAGLRDDGHRGQEADAADGLEGRQQLGVWARRGALRQGGLEAPDALGRLAHDRVVVL